MRKRSFVFVFLFITFADISLANDGGTLGDNLKWYYDEIEQSLTISGGGHMISYYPSPSPWKNYRELISRIIIREGVMSISDYAFADCSNVYSVAIPNSVRSIGYYAFYGCTSLQTLTIPSSVKEICNYAFCLCNRLSTINFSEGLSIIGYAAFAGCSSLSTIVLPSSLEYIGSYAFEGCSNVYNVYCYADYPPKVVGMSINDEFGLSSPFDQSIKWGTLHIPESSINKYKKRGSWGTFLNYEALTYFYDEPCPNSEEKYIQRCGDNSYWEYSVDEKKLTIYGSHMWVYDEYHATPWSLYNNNIGHIVLKGDLVYISSYAFYECNNISSVESEIAYPLDIPEDTFEDATYANAVLIVPYGTKSLYQSKAGWRNFANIIESETGNNVNKGITIIAEKDWTNCKEEDLLFYQIDDLGTATVLPNSEGIEITLPDKTGMAWLPLTTLIENVNLVESHSYLVKISAKIPSEGFLLVELGSWNSLWREYVEVKANNDFQEIEVKFNNFPYSCDGDGHVLFMNGLIAGTSIVKKVQIFELTSTSINNITSDSKAFDVYTIGGYKIKSQVTSFDDLPKGIYIINGKKIIK